MYEIALLLSAACMIGAIAYYVRLPCCSIYHPLTWYTAVHCLLFVIRPICGYFLHYEGIYIAFHFEPSLMDRVTVILASNLSYLCFFYWAIHFGQMPMRFNADRYDEEEKRRLTQVFVWVAVLVFPIGLYSLSLTYSSLTNGTTVEGMVLDRSTGVSYNTQANGYITDAQLLLAPTCALIAWLGRFRPTSWLPIAAFVVLRSGTGGRGPFMLALLMVALFYCYELRRRFLPVKLLAAAVPVLLLFQIIGADRGATLREWMGQQVVQDAEAQLEKGKQVKFLEAMDFANMEFFEYLVYVIPQRSGTYDYFLDNFQILTDPVPRVLWTGKPMGEPLRRIWLWDYGEPIGMTRSIPGEGWYALGWIGVVLWSSLWGAFVGVVYQKYVNSRQTMMQTACYLIFTAGLLTTYRDGQALSVVRNTGMYLFPVFVWYWVARYFGLPKAADLRRMAIQKAKQLARRQGSPAPEGSQPTGPAPAPAADMAARAHLAALPAPVRRRRLALRQMAADQAGQS